jgi:hypothetical protein
MFDRLPEQPSGSDFQLAQTIALTGTGESLGLGLTPASLNFGNISVGASATLSATLTNDGSASVDLTGFAVSPADGTIL